MTLARHDGEGVGPDGNRPGTRDDAPVFIALGVRLQTERFASVHDEHLDRGRSVLRKFNKLPPWSLFAIWLGGLHGVICSYCTIYVSLMAERDVCITFSGYNEVMQETIVIIIIVLAILFYSKSGGKKDDKKGGDKGGKK